jgi:hypothetical protein
MWDLQYAEKHYPNIENRSRWFPTGTDPPFSVQPCRGLVRAFVEIPKKGGFLWKNNYDKEFNEY